MLLGMRGHLTGFWDEASLHASWIGVSSGTGLSILIASQNCHMSLIMGASDVDGLGAVTRLY